MSSREPGGPGPQVVLPPEQPLQDCLPYNPHSLRIVDEGRNGWLLADGRSRMLMLDNEQDAIQALALARRHTHQCFIGRNNTRPERKKYIVSHWSGDSGIVTSMGAEDLVRHRPDDLKIVDQGTSGWLLTDGRSRMLMLDNERDAIQVLALAKRYGAQGFIGRSNQRANRRDYIVRYWALPVPADERRAPIAVLNCVFAPGRTGPERTLNLVLPGASAPQEVTYQVIDGYAVLDGGIVLGTDAEVRQRSAELDDTRADNGNDDLPDGFRTRQQALVALSSRNQLWDGGVVYYELEQSTTLQRNRIEEAIRHLQQNTNLRFIAAGSTASHRIIFRFSNDAGASSAELGRQPRDKQYVWLQPNFDTGGVVHEILHAVGVLHEQSRNDRDTHVTVQWANICRGREDNFRKSTAGSTSPVAYDLRSVMHYHAWAFSDCEPGDPLQVTLQPTNLSVDLWTLAAPAITHHSSARAISPA